MTIIFTSVSKHRAEDGALEVAAVDVTNNRKTDITRKLSSATCALLGALPAAHANEQEKSWAVDTAVLHYSEADNRVQAIEPVIEFKKQFREGREGTVKLTLDVLTGATPNGATATNTAQTFTRPSGSGSYTVPAGEIPLDDTFHDTRVALNGSWKHPLSRLSVLTLGANFSKEYDFLSMGASALISRDFNQKNTTLTFGLSSEVDQIDPVGGVPVPFANTVASGLSQPRQGAGDNKTLIDAILGVTQIINRRTLMQLNYSLSSASGYLNDPYKFLSRVDPNTGSTVDYVYESRPDSRTKHALYWLTRYHLNRDVVSVSYRYFFDDWGINSHTVDLNYNWKFSEKQYLEPRFRFYNQSEADFFHVNLLSGTPLPTEASADYRLAKFNGLTYGLKWGLNLPKGRELIFRLEYYTQVGDSDPASAIGIQKGLDLYPDLKATIAQVQYRF
ncbi:MAG: hypothetical protein KCHDKBKB_01399 [Elusimicrobia bacterium]|nr:hypothetical protein [Elusimicrobiota bacterium]